MAIRQIDDSLLKRIANAIRGKTNKTASLNVEDMPEEISGITGGGGSNEFAFESGNFTITDNGMFAPGANEYIFSSSNLNALSRHGIIILVDNSLVGILLQINDYWEYYGGGYTALNFSDGYGTTVTNNQLPMYGEVYNNHSYSFIAF